MRNLKAFVAALVLVAVCAVAAGAAEKAAKDPGAAAAQDVAVFSVPKLKKAELQGLAKALADKPGIVKAKADKKKQTFNVVFDRHQTNADDILAAVNTVSKEAALVSVGPADPKARSASDCGKCPKSASCPGAAKK